MSVTISVVICTHNRAQLLPQAIESLLTQTLAQSEYEILIVDNASSDNTAQIVKEKFGHITNLKYIYEPILGLCQARNCGWQNSQGKYVAYLDDDEIATSNWLSSIIHTFETVTPTPGVIGGKVVLQWNDLPCPTWLSNHTSYLGSYDFSPTPCFVGKNDYIAEGNAAFQRSVLVQLKGFYTKLGRKGNRLLCHEGLELYWRMQKAGYTAYYQPDMLIYHCILPNRLTPDWFYGCAYGLGVSRGIYEILCHDIPLWYRWLKGGAILFALFLFPYFHYTLWIAPKNLKYFQKHLSCLEHLGHALSLLGIIR